MKQLFTEKDIRAIARDVIDACEVCGGNESRIATRPGWMRGNDDKEDKKSVVIELLRPFTSEKERPHYVMVVVERFSRYTRLYTLMQMDINEIITVLKQDYLMKMGKPYVVITMDGMFRDREWGRFVKENKMTTVVKL